MLFHPLKKNKIFSKNKNSIPLQGKKEALEADTVELLVNLLKDKEVLVRSKAALAIEA